MASTSWDTATMAELYLKQGQPGRAMAIYKRLASERPQDVDVARRLAEVEAIITSRGGFMSFQENLRRVVDEVPGAIASILMGFDGIAIDAYERAGNDLDIPTLVTECSAAALQARRSAQELPAIGSIAEVSITAANIVALIRPVTHDVFLAVVLTPDGLAGKARFLMRLVAPQLVKELS